MAFEWVVEKYKQRQWKIGYEIGFKQGLEQSRKERLAEELQAFRAWYERQQAALRAGLPFDEPPPGYSPEPPANGKDAG